jgi:hypothetical protein
MDSLSQFELETNFILNPLLKELDMIYELETTLWRSQTGDGMVWRGIRNLLIEEVMDKLIAKSGRTTHLA